MRVVVVGPGDAAAVAAACAPALLPRLSGVQGYPARPTELLVAALLAAGVEVEFVTLSPSVTAPVTVCAGPLSILIGAFRSRGRARDLFRAERRSLAGLLAQTTGEVLHAHWTYEFAWSVLDDPRPRVVTVHDAPLTIARRLPSAYRTVRAGMAFRVRAGSFAGIAVSPYVAARWRREMLDPRPLEVIPDLVAVGGRTAVSTGAGAPVLVSIGDGGRLKNVRPLLVAFRQVRARHPGATMRLVGSGLNAGDPLAVWAAAHDVAGGVEWLGRLEHGPTLDAMAAADVVVHPSREESFGMSVAEAMAMGLPVVGGHESGAVPWLLDGGRAGQLVDVRSPASLARGIDRLLEDPALARRIAAAAADRIGTHFSAEAVLRRHLRVYERITGRAARGVPAWPQAGSGDERTCREVR